ncbi:TMV resistance protein N-like isoform X2 [Vigna unguiculata]|uniref:TMV resistance protein N-like isoform X2 n=1 Tax=Vigna unguiculata TaxID=3917 RepID=UPI0010169CB0|nr:TMV resistance protein N-like isoform X2 [Vigna unguiculata]
MESASSSFQHQRMYDVLINFAGEDIQRKFVSHLDSVLTSVGISTFLHHQNAVKEMYTEEPILNMCQVVIVVFTKTYSQSAWCLHQLQQIIQWHETYRRHVLPVYYEIQPSDVRLQKGDFGKAFTETAHQTFSGKQLEHGMSRWRYALTKAANFFGWDESNHRSDAELVDAIVKSVLNLSVLSATNFPVGLQSHVEDVIRTIKNKSTEVCTIGICGMEGSGKTTIAKAIYNHIHGTFKEKSFIEDIARVSRTKGYAHLQGQLLSDILKSKVEIHSVEMGRRMLQQRLLGKRVLIVLDNIDEKAPLLDLWRNHAWFNKGTVIIITTAHEHLLRTRIAQDDSIFRINVMNENESLELLSWHAFREAKPKAEYDDLAKEVVAYCGGLPLALEVIGSSLFERTKEEWRWKVSLLEKIPIAYVTKILKSCGVDADNGIRFLIDRNLIKAKRNNKLTMHPLLQDMGREIVHKFIQEEVWMKSPRFDHSYVLTNNTGKKSSRELPVKLLSSIREPSGLLKLAQNSECRSKKLRWMSLQGFSSKNLSIDFDLNDAIAIDLKRSLLRLVWKQPQFLMWLKVLNLSHSKNLTQTPDFIGLPRLERLILKDCPRLHELHHSIGFLRNLILLNLKDCTGLRYLPKEIRKLKSLKSLILSGCLKILLLEKDMMQMKSLITLVAENKPMKQVPFSIVNSESIGYISLRRFEGLLRNLFPSIIRSWMSPTMNPISYIHSMCMDIDNSWDDIEPLHGSLKNLRSVLVQCDTEFQLSKQVQNILVEYFASIIEPEISKQQLRCSLIGVGAYDEFFNVFSDNIPKDLAYSEWCDVSLPVVNETYWLAHMGEGHSVSFTVPENRVMKGMALCVFYLSTSEIVAAECLRSVLIVNYTKCTLHIHNNDTIISFNDIDWQGIKSNLGSGDKVEIFLTFAHGLLVKNTIFYSICAE